AAAVYRAVAVAVERARQGEGPTLIEAMTYRLGAHSTADDDSRYRTGEEVESRRADDPLVRMRAGLEAADVEASFFEAAAAEARAVIGRLRTELAAAPDPPAAEMFDFVYAAPPPGLARQRAEVEELA